MRALATSSIAIDIENIGLYLLVVMRRVSTVCILLWCEIRYWKLFNKRVSSFLAQPLKLEVFFIFFWLSRRKSRLQNKSVVDRCVLIKFTVLLVRMPIFLIILILPLIVAKSRLWVVQWHIFQLICLLLVLNTFQICLKIWTLTKIFVLLSFILILKIIEVVFLLVVVATVITLATRERPMLLSIYLGLIAIVLIPLIVSVVFLWILLCVFSFIRLISSFITHLIVSITLTLIEFLEPRHVLFLPLRIKFEKWLWVLSFLTFLLQFRALKWLRLVLIKFNFNLLSLLYVRCKSFNFFARKFLKN